MLKRSFVFLLLPWWCILTSIKLNAEANTVRVVTEHLAPYHIGNNNKLVGGIVGTQVQQLLNEILPGVEIEVMPWARAYHIATSRPNTIIFSLVRTPEREPLFNWIGKVAVVTTELIVLRDSKIKQSKELEDFKQYQIGAKRQDAVTALLVKNGFVFDQNLTEIVNTQSTLMMLEKGRIEAVPGNKQIVEYYCKTTGCDESNFRSVYTFNELAAEFYLATSLGTDPTIIKQLREEFHKWVTPLQ